MKKLFVATLVAWAAARGSAVAQFEVPGSTAGVNAALTQLFGDVGAFSAKANVQVLGKDQKEKITTPMDFALLDNKLRVEVDTTQIRGPDMPAGAAASMKQFGLDRVVSVIRPDKKATFIIFPGIKSFVNTPMPKEEVAAYQKKPRLNKVALGKETLDGHPCVKNRVLVSNDKGVKSESTVWNATDLKDFPIQIMTKEKDDTIIIRYRQVQFTKPEVKSFDAPAGYKEYADVQDLMQGVMAKMTGGGSGK
jgi:hypothetical protein